MKVTVTYELEIPDGYELAEPQPRYPKKGELLLSLDGRVETAMFDFTGNKHFILRPAWNWPGWIKAEWLFQTSDGVWRVSNGNRPYISHNLWRWNGCSYMIAENMFDFPPPPCNNWRESLRRNPKFRS